MTTPKFDLLLYIGEKCAKNPYFYHFSWKKKVKLGKFFKKAGAGINCGPWPIFPNITHLTHFYIWGVKCYGHIFLKLFLGKTGQITRYLEKKKIRASTRTRDPFFDNPEIWPTFIYRGEVPAHTFAKLPVRVLINDPKKNWYRHQLQPMLHFLMNQKFDLLSYFYIINFLNLPLRALIHDLQKKNIRASTRSHDPFFDNSGIWPTFIYRGEVPPDTFAKLPVCVLINDPKKNWYRHQLQPMLHFLTNHKFDLLSYFYIINFLNLPLRALIHDLQKKNLRASTRTHDPFFDNPEIWPTFIYRGEVPADTFAKLPVRALINDPKKLFQKKVYVTIPQWFETFPNVSDLRSGRNRAKCGLALNDPIDWFKLRLNQPTTNL